MLKKITLFFVIGAFYPLLPITYANPTIFTLPIQFPTLLKNIPRHVQNVWLYYCGQRINKDDYNHQNKILFSILESRKVTHFWLLVIDSLPQVETIWANTIDCLTINTSHHYKFYALSLVPRENAATQKTEYVWVIAEEQISKSGKLPDNTIIMVYNPDFIDHLTGGSAIELPTIILNKDILKQPNEELQAFVDQQSIEIILSSLDFNAIHEKPVTTSTYDPETKTVRTINA